jgi:hypothetical protein
MYIILSHNISRECIVVWLVRLELGIVLSYQQILGKTPEADHFLLSARRVPHVATQQIFKTFQTGKISQ